ncbi:MAG: lysophospholipid acyltransferase family protein [Anaerolineales bacterium]
MPTQNSAQPKPHSQVIRPEITRLPPLTPWRLFWRTMWRWTSKILVWLFTRPQVKGLENFPRHGPALLVVNHLGDADGPLGLAYFPVQIDALAKAELYDYPLLGWLMEAYGVIWVHRGQPDRRALRAALHGLAEGRIVGIAPEGRESLTGTLEEATHGAAFLALKSGAPLLPVTFTGTENRRVYANIKRLRRTRVSLTVGPLFHLELDENDRKNAIENGTLTIMKTLAAQLPPEYRGVYQLD